MSEGGTKRDLLAKAGLRMSAREYRANIEGLNIFFGAILGVVMTDLGDLSPLIYAVVLTVIASFVVTIIYITASTQRRSYAFYALIGLLGLWAAAHRFGAPHGLNLAHIDRRVIPTLAVWLAMTIIVEFAPRAEPTKDDTTA